MASLITECLALSRVQKIWCHTWGTILFVKSRNVASMDAGVNCVSDQCKDVKYLGYSFMWAMDGRKICILHNDWSVLQMNKSNRSKRPRFARKGEPNIDKNVGSVPPTNESSTIWCQAADKPNSSPTNQSPGASWQCSLLRPTSSDWQGTTPLRLFTIANKQKAALDKRQLPWWTCRPNKNSGQVSLSRTTNKRWGGSRAK